MGVSFLNDTLRYLNQAGALSTIEARTADKVVIVFPIDWPQQVCSALRKDMLPKNVVTVKSDREEQILGLGADSVIVVGHSHESEGISALLLQLMSKDNGRFIIIGDKDLHVLQGDELYEYYNKLNEVVDGEVNESSLQS